MPNKDILNATIELSKILISKNPNKYESDSDALEELLILISNSIKNADEKGCF